MMATLFNSSVFIFTAATMLRLFLLFYGLYQDAHSAVKYTDIDYIVFTDAARYVSRGLSPYARDTYRYTPLLAWMLLPTTWANPWGSSLWFLFGKTLFATADIITGWLLMKVLQQEYRMSESHALKYASLWLLNPMVATISTRGSSEGLLGVMVIALLWAIMRRKVTLAGFLLGLGVHFKIYPFIYGPSMIWWLHTDHDNKIDTVGITRARSSVIDRIVKFITPSRVSLTLVALATFSALSLSMYLLYGLPFIEHTYLHHLTRIDHRHNFSPYNILLYYSAAEATKGGIMGFESLAFIPQLFLSALAIPVVLARKSLPGTMLAQTFAFATFNKVCTSQYFLWYLVFLPLYFPFSSFLKRPALGISAAFLWILTQGTWLHQGYRLEFLGISNFYPNLWLSSLAFFAVNVWILGIIITDVGSPQVSGSDNGLPDHQTTKTATTYRPGDSGFEDRKRKMVAEYIQELEEMDARE